MKLQLDIIQHSPLTLNQCLSSMKSRKCVLSIISVVGILLLWQLTLVIIAIKDSFIGINFNSFNINTNEQNSTIPRIIHQMWKINNLSEYRIQNSHVDWKIEYTNSQLEWKMKYPNYEIRLWTDKDLEILINKEEYKYLKPIYESYPYSIQRADLGRLIILHSEGGIYVDLDVFPLSNKTEYLRLSNVSFLIPRSYTGSSLINHFLIAQKSSVVIDYILHEMVPVKFYRRIYLIPYLEVFSTGTLFLTRIINKYIQLSDKNDDLWILSENEVKSYVLHEGGRSWHSIDGVILNKLGDSRKFYLSIFIILIICLISIYKYRNLIYKLIPFRYKKLLNEN